MGTPALRNSVGMAVASVASAGVGTITLGAALSGGYQTAATAYGADANIDIRIEEGDTWEVCRDCAYTHSGTTVSRGTLEDGSSGTGTRVAFTSAAKVYVVETAQRITAGSLSSFAPIAFDSPGAYITRASATSLSLSAGSAVVNGELLQWASAITWSGTSGTAPLNAAQLVHWYIYDASGTPTLEAGTTAPVWDGALGYAKKTGDATRRWVFSGYVYSGAAGYRILPFLAQQIGTVSRVVFQGEYIDASNGFGAQNGNMNVVSAGSSSSLASFTCAFAPHHATAAYLTAKGAWASGTFDANLGITQSDTVAAGGVGAVYVSAAYRSPIGSGKIFFGPGWVPIAANRALYYVILVNAGTGTIEIVNDGYEALL